MTRELECLIDNACMQLAKSECGQLVMIDLYTFFCGRINGLDQPGWDAVLTLIDSYRHGFPGSVMEKIQPFDGI